MLKIGDRKRSRNPETIRQVLQELRGVLTTTLGDDLQALIVYGDYVKPGRCHAEHDHVNLMLVLQRTDFEVLDRIVEPLAGAERRIPLATMTLTREDLQTSCDVFPVKFRDIQLHHRLLCGVDVLADLVIADDHLRLRCEQELKNVMIRLRSVYLHQSRHPERLFETLLVSGAEIVRTLEACLSLKMGMIPEGDMDVARMFGGEFALKTDSLVEILQMRDRIQPPPLEDLKRVWNGFMEFVENAARAADQLETVA